LQEVTVATTLQQLDCVVGYDADVPCVVMRWTGYDRNGFRGANGHVLEEIVERRADRLLGEMEALTGVSLADADWLANDWIPRAVAAGLRRAALVTSAFDLGHAPLRLVGERLPAGLELRYFDDAGAAREWLGRE
jgi:hypothetical protein